MAFAHNVRIVLTGASAALIAAVVTIPIARAQTTASAPLAIDTARVSIAGTSNIHAYTASTTAVRLTRVQLASAIAGQNVWDEIVKPGALQQFEVAIGAATLSSPKEGLDKNMHKALKVQQHPDITFRLLRLQPGAAGTLEAVGMLQIAGVEREVTLNLKTLRTESTLTITGDVQLLMTDYSISPPKAMLGMLKTDPKVTVTFETVLSVPLT